MGPRGNAARGPRGDTTTYTGAHNEYSSPGYFARGWCNSSSFYPTGAPLCPGAATALWLGWTPLVHPPTHLPKEL